MNLLVRQEGQVRSEISQRAVVTLASQAADIQKLRVVTVCRERERDERKKMKINWRQKMCWCEYATAIDDVIFPTKNWTHNFPFNSSAWMREIVWLVLSLVHCQKSWSMRECATPANKSNANKHAAFTLIIATRIRRDETMHFERTKQKRKCAEERCAHLLRWMHKNEATANERSECRDNEKRTMNPAKNEMKWAKKGDRRCINHFNSWHRSK